MEEIQKKAHYVVVTGIIKKQNKYLICKRSPFEKAFPEKWCVPGGKIECKDFINTLKDTSSHWLDIFEKTLQREIFEETGIKIKNMGYVSNLAFIRPNGFSTLIVSLYAEHDEGEVILNKDELTEYAWVTLEQAKKYDLIENIYEQIEKVHKIHKKNKKRVGAGVGAMILKDNKILLGKRHEDPEKASSLLHGEGTWTMPGGKIDFGEEIEQAIEREVFEETGIIIKNPKIISTTNDKVDSAHFITIGLLVEDFNGEAQVKEPEEITEWRWFDLDNLPSPMFFPCIKIIENYRKSISREDASKPEKIPKDFLGPENHKSFLGKPLGVLDTQLTPKEYQKKCKRTNKVFNPPEMEILTWGLGIAGEAGDVAGCIKKIYAHKNNQIQGVRENLGDTMWYIAMICNYYGWNLEDIMQENIDKLKKRYPGQGFTYEDAQRDHSRTDWNEN